jgi:inosine-uridine nucleoside N-ribohydrolase
MGGALSNPTGNKQPYAEANFFNDAIAARMVLRAGFVPPVVLVPLEATHTTSFRNELADALEASGPVGRCHACLCFHTCAQLPNRFVAASHKFYAEFYTRNGHHVVPIHDATALYAYMFWFTAFFLLVSKSLEHVLCNRTIRIQERAAGG